MKVGEVLTGLDAHAIAFTKDRTTAYITNQGAGTVSVVDVTKRTKLKDIPVGKKTNGIFSVLGLLTISSGFALYFVLSSRFGGQPKSGRRLTPAA